MDEANDNVLFGDYREYEGMNAYSVYITDG
jgi:hypothetical protein